MQSVNVGWGAPRIHGGLLKLGIEISQATVSKYRAAPKHSAIAILVGDGVVMARHREFENRVMAPNPGARPIRLPKRNWRIPK
jgi:hypothetical protein